MPPCIVLKRSIICAQMEQNWYTKRHPDVVVIPRKKSRQVTRVGNGTDIWTGVDHRGLCGRRVAIAYRA